MDIYLCMSCGQRWPHGSHQAFLDTCQHTDASRFSPEGMHHIRVGERMALEAQYERHQAGEPLVMGNSDNHPIPAGAPPIPTMAPDKLDELARRVGMTPQQVEALLIGLFPAARERPTPESAADDVIPIGQLMIFPGGPTT